MIEMVEEKLKLGEVMTVTEVAKRIKTLENFKTDVWGNYRYYNAMKNHSEGSVKERFEHKANISYEDYKIIRGKLNELYKVLGVR